MIFETARLVRAVEDQIGEDNVAPWLVVHHTLVQAASRGYKIGLKAAIERVLKACN